MSKHYELVARAMVQARQDVWNDTSYKQWVAGCNCLAVVFTANNLRFNRDKFMEVCKAEW